MAQHLRVFTEHLHGSSQLHVTTNFCLPSARINWKVCGTNYAMPSPPTHTPKMAQWLKALAVLPEGLGSIPSTQVTTVCITLDLEDLAPSHSHICRETIVHIKRKSVCHHTSHSLTYLLIYLCETGLCFLGWSWTHGDPCASGLLCIGIVGKNDNKMGVAGAGL